MRSTLVPALLLVASAISNGCATRSEPVDVAADESILAGILRAEDRRALDDAVLEAAGSEPAATRARAMLAMGRIGDPVALERLHRALLEDRDPSVRGSAALALGILGDETSVPFLAEGGNDPEGTVRERVARALGMIGTAGSAAPLERLLDDPSRLVRHEACLAVWRVPDPSFAVDRLSALAASSDPAVAFAASYALGRLGSSRANPGGSAAVRDRLVELARNPAAEIRIQVARGLARPKTPLETSTLVSLTRDDDFRVRSQAFRSLSQPGTRLVPTVNDGLRDTDHVVRATLELLGNMQQGASAETLVQALERDPRFWIQEAALDAIARVFPELVPEIVPPLSSHPNARLRAAAAGVLGTREEPEARALLMTLLDDRAPMVQAAAVLGLSVRREPLSETIGHLIAPTTDPSVRAAIARAAGNRLARRTAGPEEKEEAIRALALLWDHAKDDEQPGARLAVLDGAASAGASPAGAEILRQGLEDRDLGVRARAIDLLLEIHGEDHRGKTAEVPGRPLDEYVSIAEWSKSSWAAVVVVQRSGYNPGRFTVRLDTTNAPLTSWNFAKRASEGYFDGQLVHRVVPGVLVQTGDPRGDGFGGPGFTIRDEIGEARFGAGALGMASSGRDAAGSQWFVTLSADPRLEGRYTAFGHVVQNFAGVASLIIPGDRIVRVVVYEGDGSEPLPPISSEPAAPAR